MSNDEFEISVNGGGVSISKKIGADRAQTIIEILLSPSFTKPTASQSAVELIQAQEALAKDPLHALKVKTQAKEMKISSTDLANQIKEHQLFDRFNEKVLLKRDFWQKVVGVLALLNHSLLPGELANILTELGAKAVANNVSTYLGNHKSSLIMTGAKGNRLYRLTNKAKLDFEKTLNGSN